MHRAPLSEGQAVMHWELFAQVRSFEHRSLDGSRARSDGYRWEQFLWCTWPSQL
jgi:hypothetical protein